MFLSTTRYSQANTIGFIFHETIRPASRLGSIGRCDSIRRISRCFRRRAHWHAFILSSELGAGGMLTKSPRTHRNSSQNRVAESNPPLREDTAARLPAKISATRPLFNLSKNLGVVCIKVVLFASDCATSSAIIAVSRSMSRFIRVKRGAVGAVTILSYRLAWNGCLSVTTTRSYVKRGPLLAPNLKDLLSSAKSRRSESRSCNPLLFTGIALL